MRRDGTLLVVGDTGQVDPWVLLTSLPPAEVGVCWYGLWVRRLWTRVWLVPQAWPAPAPDLVLTRILPPLEPLRV